MLKVICVTEGHELEEGGRQLKKHALDLTWVGLCRRAAFKITRAASIKGSCLCTYRGVSMGGQQEARWKLVGSPVHGHNRLSRRTFEMLHFCHVLQLVRH